MAASLAVPSVASKVASSKAIIIAWAALVASAASSDTSKYRCIRLYSLVASFRVTVGLVRSPKE